MISTYSYTIQLRFALKCAGSFRCMLLVLCTHACMCVWLGVGVFMCCTYEPSTNSPLVTKSIDQIMSVNQLHE